MTKKYFLLLLFFSCLNAASLAEQTTASIDLSKSWKVFRNGEYKAFHIGERVRAIYFVVGNPNGLLEINSVSPFSLFIDGQLAFTDKKHLRLNIDSLSRHYANLQMTIYSRSEINPRLLSTLLIDPSKDMDLSRERREENGSADFFILAGVFLLIVFSLFYRSNPRLMLDYLSFQKIFSLREREEKLLSNRITSSSNLLFYTASAFLLAFVLLAVIQFGTFPLAFSNYFKFHTTQEAFAKWTLFSLLIVASQVAKLFLIAIFSFIFKLRSTLQMHFYNFIKTLFLISIIFIFLFVMLHVLKGSLLDQVVFFSWIVITIWLGWLLAITLKLMANTSFRFFHLFSYLCVTEIIPTIVLIKIIS